MSSVLPGASAADTVQPGSVVFLLDPSKYRVLHCNAQSDIFLDYPSFGNKKSSLFAPKCAICSPPKPSVTLAIDTDTIEIDVPMSRFPVPPSTLPDIAESCTLTLKKDRSVCKNCYNTNTLNLMKKRFGLLEENSSRNQDVSDMQDSSNKEDISNKQVRSRKQNSSRKQDSSNKQVRSRKQDSSFNMKNVDPDCLM